MPHDKIQHSNDSDAMYSAEWLAELSLRPTQDSRNKTEYLQNAKVTQKDFGNISIGKLRQKPV